MTYICAPDDASAAARAERAGVTEWQRVGPDPADIEGTSGELLFAEGWRETFGSIEEQTTHDDAAAFLATAYRQTPALTIEVTL